jgi:murein DD-endopeptidase MepM/ murein hydrolase activator NlpD
MHKYIRYVDYGNRFSSRFFSRMLFSYVFLLKFIILSLLTALAVNNFFFLESKDLVNRLYSASGEEEQKSNIEIMVKSGDNLSRILQANDISKADIVKVIDAAKNVDLHKKLKAGAKIKLEYETIITENGDLTNEIDVLKQLTYEISPSQRIEIMRSEDGDFNAILFEVPLKKVLSKHSAVISSSFLEAAKSMRISTKSIIKLINAFSHKIDFQRDIQEGDKIEIITEKYYTEEGKFSSSGDVLYASLILSSGEKHNIYLYSKGDGKPEYFSEDAETVRQNFLRTPLKIIRISSHYGHRHHPILGFTKMHKGVDFAAPSGTPIYASGDGIVTTIGYHNAYGRYIKIKHANGMSTAYAHLSKFTNNLKCGSRVKQGQVIGLVGMSGSMATAPHLHYEVWVNNKHVNPLSIKTTAGFKLSGKDMKNFKAFKQDMLGLSRSLDDITEIGTDKLSFLMR